MTVLSISEENHLNQSLLNHLVMPHIYLEKQCFASVVSELGHLSEKEEPRAVTTLKNCEFHSFSRSCFCVLSTCCGRCCGSAGMSLLAVSTWIWEGFQR